MQLSSQQFPLPGDVNWDDFEVATEAASASAGPLFSDDDPGLMARIAKRDVNRGRDYSRQIRAEDDRITGLFMREERGTTWEERGGARYGNIPTKELGMEFIKDPSSRVPEALLYTKSRAPGWRRNSEEREVPIVGIGTLQSSVSSGRLDMLAAYPGSDSSPRLPYTELPRVVSDAEGDVVIDGNHRIAAALERGEMFQPARVIDATDADAQVRVADQEYRFRRNLGRASRNPRAAAAWAPWSDSDPKETPTWLVERDRRWNPLAGQELHFGEATFD